jgi:hypothetical protein
MGEIKSTLDLVMEKTKHLSLSSEEKQAQTDKEVKSRIKGMLQKYQDGMFSIEQLPREYEALKKEFKLTDNTIMAAEVIYQLNPDLENHSLLEVLEHCCQLDCAGLEDVINEYKAGCHSAAQSRMEALKESLAQKHNISGSAVVPNLEADEKWHLEAQELRSGFKDKLSRERVNLLGKES